MIRKIISAMSDLWVMRMHQWFGYQKRTSYAFAFLVHARSHKDMYRQFPFLKHFPKGFVLWLMSMLWPITLSSVTGLTSAKGGSEVPGFVLGITMTAAQMLQNRNKALKKIRQAAHLACGKGVTLIGLGGLTSSMSGGGLELLDLPIRITTGHAYTAYNVAANVRKIVHMFEVPKGQLIVGIVSAAGSIGSMTAELLAADGYKELVLIDIPRKMDTVLTLHTQLSHVHVGMISSTEDIREVSRCDIVVTATNTPEALITTELVREGQVYIDDAQPSDIHHDVLTLPHVLVLEAGVVDTPGIHSNFHYGLKNRTDNFCCMAELLILASHLWDNHYVIHRATKAHVEDIAKLGEHLNFKVASFQNFLESIPSQKIMHVRDIFRCNHGISS